MARWLAGGGGAMVTGQIDTCITHPFAIAPNNSRISQNGIW